MRTNAACASSLGKSKEIWSITDAGKKAFSDYPDPGDFYREAVRLYRAWKAGAAHVEWVAPPRKDGGVDIIALTDPPGTKPPRIKVQVKGGQQRIDLQTLNAFLAVVDVGDIGLYVSIGGFTRDAEDAARKQISRKITLISAERLVDHWIEAYDKLDQKARQRLPLSPIYFLTPED